MKPTRRAFLRGAGAALALTARSQPNDAPTPAEAEAMLRVVLAFLDEHSVPGISVAVARRGELVYAHGFGLADRDRKEKVTPASLFRIASVSKPITSVALFGLIERGKLRLDDPVFGPGAVLGLDYGKPPYSRYIADIRLKHLMTHTCGGWQNDAHDPMFSHAGFNHHQLIEWTLANQPLANAPGQHYAYSNFGYCVLGRVVEKVTGRQYDDYVREQVLHRCGVDDMRISGNRLADRAAGEVVYYGSGGEDPYDMNVRRMDSHGGWLASAGSLVRFAVRVDGLSEARDILRPATIREMTTATQANAQYAKGWAVNAVPNWWHTGSLPGTASILVRTASGFCWAALANSREAKGDTGGALDRMMWDMVRQVKRWNA